MTRTLRFSTLNITLAYIAISLVAIAFFAIPLWYSWHNTIEQSRTEVLRADAQKLVDLFVKNGSQALAAAIDTQVGGELENVENTIILFTDARFAKQAGNLAKWPDDFPLSSDIASTSIQVDGRNVSATLLHKILPGGFHLLVGRDTGRFEKLEDLFLYGLTGAAGIVMLLGIAGGLLIRRSLLSRVQDINQTTSAIMQGDLSHRLPAYKGETEFNMLVETENRMLDQIEHLVNGVRNVSNSIAHDLRTPLAELRFRLEELSLTRPAPEHVFSEIDSAIVDVDRVIAIFNALLRLTEIDAGTRRSGFVTLDINEVANQVYEFYQPVAEMQEVSLSFTSPTSLTFSGDPLLLAQAIGNLVDNALKYVQKGGAIAINTSQRPDGTIAVAVMDNGPGIADEEKPKVTERFYRSDASRGTPGVGLGLSLVAAVAKLHGGNLELSDNHPGLIATLVIPAPPGKTGA